MSGSEIAACVLAVAFVLVMSYATALPFLRGRAVVKSAVEGDILIRRSRMHPVRPPIRRRVVAVNGSSLIVGEAGEREELGYRALQYAWIERVREAEIKARQDALEARVPS